MRAIPAASATTSPIRAGWRLSLSRNKLMTAAAGFLLFVALGAICAPLLPLADPMAMEPAQRLRPPSLEHPFGTDSFGRDVFGRALHGGHCSWALA